MQDDDPVESESENSHFGAFQCEANITQSCAELNLKCCVLLDNESTVHAFCNRDLVLRVFTTDKNMSLVTNGGVIVTNQMCEVQGIPQPVWFHPKYITNVLSLCLLTQIYRITYDSDKDGAFIVHRPNKSNLIFTRQPGGLNLIRIDPNTQHLSFVNTVSDNLTRYSRRQIGQARVARELLAKVGYPKESDLKSILDLGLFHNCSITSNDVDMATQIYGPSIPLLKGKTVRRHHHRY